jgi:hypothetical protein
MGCKARPFILGHPLSLLGVETTIVSIIAPGTKIYEDSKKKERTFARKLNEYSADLIKNNSKQFRFFVSSFFN